MTYKKVVAQNGKELLLPVKDIGLCPPTPELNALNKAIKEKGTQFIGEFIDWLILQDITLCRYCVNEYYPTYKSKELLLAEYSDIDLDKVEKERRAILKYIQSTINQ